MKKIGIISIVFIFMIVVSCGHYASIINFLNCIFYGECSDFYYIGSTNSVQLVATGENDGATLIGEWQNKNADNSYILTFKENGKLNIALYDAENTLERYDIGEYRIENNNMIINMANGTYSVVNFVISNKKLILSSAEGQEIKNKEDN